jgi:hypothetical protein
MHVVRGANGKRRHGGGKAYDGGLSWRWRLSFLKGKMKEATRNGKKYKQNTAGDD